MLLNLDIEESEDDDDDDIEGIEPLVDEDSSGNQLLLTAEAEAQLERGVKGYTSQSAEQFIKHYSTINTTSNTNISESDWPQYAMLLQGGSRAPPSRHQFHCSKTSGCTFTTAWANNFKLHLISCGEPPKFTCNIPGCSKAYKQLNNLNKHVRDVHDFIHKACPVPGCQHTKIFTNLQAFKFHQTEEHAADYSKCLVEFCGDTITPANRTAYYLHLRNAHEMKNSTDRNGSVPTRVMTRKYKKK